MNYEQKFLAMNAIARAEVCIRGPHNWYVHQRVELKNGPMLETISGSGITPESAIDDHWSQLTDIADSQYLVTYASGGRRAIRWNGFMWADVPERPQHGEGGGL